jgi:hypothetical protein
MQAGEKLKPVESELRRIEASVNEIVQEMEYLRMREQKLRDTNESTNERVKWFALGTMGMLVGLGAWQVVYLRAYFRYVACSCSFVFESREAKERCSSRLLFISLTGFLRIDRSISSEQQVIFATKTHPVLLAGSLVRSSRIALLSS